MSSELRNSALLSFSFLTLSLAMQRGRDVPFSPCKCLFCLETQKRLPLRYNNTHFLMYYACLVCIFLPDNGNSTNACSHGRPVSAYAVNAVFIMPLRRLATNDFHSIKSATMCFVIFWQWFNMPESQLDKFTLHQKKEEIWKNIVTCITERCILPPQNI